MVGGLGTPTHSAVVDFLNSEEVPDLFVSSGSHRSGGRPGGVPVHLRLAARLRDRGQDHRPVRRREHARREGRAVPPGRRLRPGRREGRPAVPRRPDRRGRALHLRQHRRRRRRSPALQAKGADLVLGFNMPVLHRAEPAGRAAARTTSRSGSTPTSAPTRRWSARCCRSSPRARSDGASLLDGVLTTEYIPGVDATDDPWVQLWQKVWDEHGEDGRADQLPDLRHVAGLHVRPGAAGRRPGPDPRRHRRGGRGVGADARRARGWRRSGYSADSHLGITGMQVVQLKGGVGEPLTPVLATDIGDAPIEEDDLRPGRRRPAGERDPRGRAGRRRAAPRSADPSWARPPRPARRPTPS